jgi:hypothetical protein
MRLCTGRKAHRVSRGTALHFHDQRHYKGMRGQHHAQAALYPVSITPRPLFTLRKVPVPIVQEAGWAPGPVWTGAENLAPTGIRSPDRPARTQSLYRLRYPAHLEVGVLLYYSFVPSFTLAFTLTALIHHNPMTYGLREVQSPDCHSHSPEPGNASLSRCCFNSQRF